MNRRPPIRTRERAPAFVPSYQFTPEASKGNAFAWLVIPRPSIFSTDKTMVVNGNGESPSQTAARAVREFEDTTGRSRGTVFGISKKSDAGAEEFNRQIALRVKKKRSASHYAG